MADDPSSPFGTAPVPPRWVEKESQEISGLDLLGLRAPVTGIGYTLIDGVTTVSPVVRYLSLRAWTTHFYTELGLPDTSRDFLEFATRIESAVVIGNLLHNPDMTGLIGSEAAHKIVEESSSEVPIHRLVKQPAANIYLSPSMQLGIAFARGNGIAGITEERGLPLAKLVDEKLAKTQFVKNLKRNPTLTKAERADLLEIGKAFPMNSPNAKERRAILSAILPKNPRSEQERNRTITYGLLLEIACNEGSVEEYDIFNYSVDPDCDLLPTYAPWLDGWACYLIRDMLAVVHECALAAMLSELHEVGAENRPVQGYSMLKELITDNESIKGALESLNLLPDGKTPLDKPLRSLAELLDKQTKPILSGAIPRWKGLSEEDVIGVAWDEGVEAIAMLPVAWLLALSRVEKAAAEKETLSEKLSVQGWSRIGLAQVVSPDLENMLKRDVTIRQAMLELGMRTMDQHVRIAWSRLSADPRRDASLLSVDGDLWSLKKGKEFRAGRTASRLNQALGWLHQLDLLDSNGCTGAGKRYLDQVRSLAIEMGAGE